MPGNPLGATTAPPLIDLSDTTYELTVVLGNFAFHEQRSGDRIPPTSPFWCVASVVMDACETFGEPVPFTNGFYDPGEYGELYVDSEPPARVFIDGRDTGLFTPIVNLRLSPGRHDIRFVNADLGIDRQYDVTIVIGLTTRLDVQLR